MTVHLLRAMTSASADVRLVAEIFRKLAEFRRDYDESVLQELVAMLRRRMSERQADKVMCDALAMDNELRFRLPAGLSLHRNETGLPCADARALITLIAHACDPDDSLAATAAEELGVRNHRVLRKCASVLALSLAQGGLEIGWEAPPAMQMEQMEARASPDVDLRL
jgi:hypothetical protein